MGVKKTTHRSEIIEAQGLSCWASYLVNGDDSGIDAEERQAADRFAAYLGGDIVDCKDFGYGRAEGPDGVWGDLCTYTALSF